MWLVISGKKHKLKKHYCFYLRPDLDIGFSTNPEDPAKFYWVSFVGQNALSYLEKMGFSEGKFSFYVPTKTQKRLRRAYFSSFDIPEALKPATDVVFTENFMKITETLMLSSNINRQEAPPKAKKRYVEETLQLINARYMNPGLSIKEVARELFLHENYLSKLFKAETKMSFNTYLSRYRIEQSLKMMVQGHTSVSSIAFAVGFSDPLYFSKVFKLLNQITPSEHIRKINAKK